jgi:uncharacterized cupin superfamily protein
MDFSGMEGFVAEAKKALDVAEAVGCGYPPPHDAPVRARGYRRLGDVFGLTQFGVNLTRLPPNTWSSQRHWHRLEDEFIYVLQGEVVLITESGEQLCHAGDCVGFKAGVRDGHHFVNCSTQDVLLLAVGSRVAEDHGEYSDIDMVFLPERYQARAGETPEPYASYARKDGTRFKP